MTVKLISQLLEGFGSDRPVLITQMSRWVSEIFKKELINERQHALLVERIKRLELDFDDMPKNSACVEYFEIGRQIGEFANAIGESEKLRVKRLELTDERRKHPLLMKNMSSKDVRELAQLMAEMLWTNDKNKSVRVGEMAELVKSNLVEEIYTSKLLDEDTRDLWKAALPETTDIYLKWIRSVAPEYAKKGGRPKK
jgi:hypothetical protein